MKHHSVLLAAALLAVFRPGAAAQDAAADLGEFIQIVGDYNLVSFGDADLSSINNDTQGPLAIGGN